jgi:hypothetical protein
VIYASRVLAANAIREHALLNENEKLQWVDKINRGVLVSVKYMLNALTQIQDKELGGLTKAEDIKLCINSLVSRASGTREHVVDVDDDDASEDQEVHTPAEKAGLVE